MLTSSRLVAYLCFLVSLGIWTGAAVHDTIGSHPGWWANPAGYVRNAVTGATVNPWPYTTAALALFTLAASVAFVRYRGASKRDLWVVLGGVAVILAATAGYFVPTLGRLANHTALTDEQITAMSVNWMRLNVLRLVFLLGLFVYGLVALVRIVKADVEAVNDARRSNGEGQDASRSFASR